MEHSYEEKEIITEIKENFEIEDETIERILEDFKKLGIKDEEFLKELTIFVVWKKVSLAINKSVKRLGDDSYEQENSKFLYDVCEQEAIEYYANENVVFSEKHANLLRDGEQYLDDKFNYFSGSYDDDESYAKKRH